MRRFNPVAEKIVTNEYGIPRAKHLMPNNDTIVREAISRLSKKTSGQHIEGHFFESLEEVMAIGYKIYLEHERRAKQKSVKMIRDKHRAPNEKREEIFFQSGIDFENSATQMRKARAGGAFESYIEKLLEYIGIPSEKSTGKFGKLLNRTDRVIPSVAVARKHSDRAIFLSMKTSLAERWRQVPQEQKRMWTVYLITLDKKLSVNKASEINDSGLVLFVRDEIKLKEGIKDLNNVRSLSDLPEHLSQYRKN